MGPFNAEDWTLTIKVRDYQGLEFFQVGNEIGEGQVEFVPVSMEEVCYPYNSGTPSQPDVSCGGGFRIEAYKCATYCSTYTYCGTCVSETLKTCHWDGESCVDTDSLPDSKADLPDVSLYTPPMGCCPIC